MSTTCSVACLDCLDEAPSIGDGGFVGGPSLEAGTYNFKDWDDSLPTFWTLYEPLIGLGLRTFELEDFYSWLKAHRGHRVHLYCEQGDIPWEVEQIDTTREAKIERVLKAKARRAEIAAWEAEGVLVRGLYYLECMACNASIESPDVELFTPVVSLQVSPTAVRMFTERWRPLLDPGPFHVWRMLSTATDPEGPFVPELLAFLDHHGEHPLVASTRRANAA